MCGTGRITLPILQSSLAIEGLDRSAGLLQVFRHKLAQAGLSTPLHWDDARSFSLPKRYGLIFIGFHSIAEVIDDDDKLAVFRCARQHLKAGGQFWVSIHNPGVQQQQIDGTEKLIGHFPLQAPGQLLTVTGRYQLDAASGLVTGIQRYVVSRPSSEPETIELLVAFHLIAPNVLRDLVQQAGLSVTETLGDYDGSPFCEQTSPYYLLGSTLEPSGN